MCASAEQMSAKQGLVKQSYTFAVQNFQLTPHLSITNLGRLEFWHLHSMCQLLLVLHFTCQLY